MVISCGDEIEANSFSMKFGANPDLPSPGHELELAVDGLKKWYKAFPNVEVVESDHGYRLFRKLRCSGLPTRVARRYEEILEYPKGWHLNSPGIEVDGVWYFHGEGISGASWHRAHHQLKQSAVFGHWHSRGGVVYSQTRKKKYFSMNVGCLINPKAECFDYAKNSIEKPTLGCGVVIDGQEAYFVPMPESLANKC